MKDLDYGAAVGLVVVCEADECENSRAEVGMVGPDVVDNPYVPYAWADVANTCCGYLLLDIAVVPRKALSRPRRDRRAAGRRRAGAASRCEEEPVRVAEEREGRR